MASFSNNGIDSPWNNPVGVCWEPSQIQSCGCGYSEKFNEPSDGIDSSVIIRVATCGHFAETKLIANDAAAGDGFGGAVAASGDTIPVETTTMGIIPDRFRCLCKMTLRGASRRN